jgi:transcription elongation factor GreA
MSEKPIFLTPDGQRRLQEELEYLRSVRRAEVAERIHAAKEGGDIMENAAYDEAKNEQAFLEGRILTLETMLKKAIVIEKDETSDTVALGSTVTVTERGSTSETFQIVGSAEANPTNGRISYESPVGRALLGSRVGDEIAVSTPDGVRHFQILAIG